MHRLYDKALDSEDALDGPRLDSWHVHAHLRYLGSCEILRGFFIYHPTGDGLCDTAPPSFSSCDVGGATSGVRRATRDARGARYGVRGVACMAAASATSPSAPCAQSEGNMIPLTPSMLAANTTSLAPPCSQRHLKRGTARTAAAHNGRTSQNPSQNFPANYACKETPSLNRSEVLGGTTSQNPSPKQTTSQNLFAGIIVIVSCLSYPLLLFLELR